jgi:hypothetical protein
MKLIFKKFDDRLKQLEFNIEPTSPDDANRVAHLQESLRFGLATYRYTVSNCDSLDIFLACTKGSFLGAGVTEKQWDKFKTQIKEAPRNIRTPLPAIAPMAEPLRTFNAVSLSDVPPPIARSAFTIFKRQRRKDDAASPPAALPAIREEVRVFSSKIEKTFSPLPLSPSKPTLTFPQVHTLKTIQAISEDDSPSNKKQKKYDDADLLTHPHFIKVLYKFAMGENSHERIEFYRDTVRFREGVNRASMSINDEAKTLHKAYISRVAMKYMSFLSPNTMFDIRLALRTQNTDELSPLLFSAAEREAEDFIIRSSLHRFKKTADYHKILRYITFDPKQLAKNKEMRQQRDGVDEVMQLPNAVEESSAQRLQATR